MSLVARDFLFRIGYLEWHGHEMRDADAFTMWQRIREDAAYLIGWQAA